MKLILGILTFLVSLPAGATDMKLLAVGDIMTLTEDGYGEYDVVCANGNQEHVTDLDLKIGNVCPNVKESRPTRISKLERRPDGDFNVTCRDGSMMIASAAQIQAGDLCAFMGVIEDGTYKAVSGHTSYYDQNATFVQTGGVLTAAHISLANGYTADFTCQATECTGKGSNGNDVQLRVLGQTSYEFYDTGVGYWGTFEKQ